MIFLHCGWPKTGTTSLQSALVRNQGRLAAAGAVYPERWRRSNGDHWFEGMLEAYRQSSDPGPELKRFLGAMDGESIILSSENLTVWTLGQRKPDAFMRFIADLGKVTPVRCVWTLRRADEMAHSLYRQMSFEGANRFPPDFLDRLDLREVFENMRKIEAAVNGDVIYLRYEPDGRHNANLLRACDLSEEIVGAIERELDDDPRLNPSVTQKGLASVLGIEQISARAGVTLELKALRRAIREGFEFDNDSACTIAGSKSRRALHERTLDAARALGFDPYVRFFGDETVSDAAQPVSLDPAILTEADIAKLIAYLHSTQSAEHHVSVPSVRSYPKSRMADATGSR